MLQLSALVERTQTTNGMDLLLKTGLLAAYNPSNAILPLYGANYCLLVGSSLALTRRHFFHVEPLAKCCPGGSRAHGSTHEIPAWPCQESTAGG
jgi:hypothetical protein